MNQKAKGLCVVVAAFAVMATQACSKKEEPPPPQTESTEVPFVQPESGVGSDTPAISAGAPVILSDSVKGKWAAVQLTVEDRQNKKTRDYTVKLQSELNVPDSGLRVKVMEFIPDLKIEGNQFTSASEELLNPAVHVVISEGGKEIFDGWLFQLFPSVHPFQHDRYSLVLKAPVSDS